MYKLKRLFCRHEWEICRKKEPFYCISGEQLYKRCAKCGKVSFKYIRLIDQNLKGDKKVVYWVRVICNKCRGRGAPVTTDGLINPNPYISKWGNGYNPASVPGAHQTEMFEPYVKRAIDAWNRRAN